MSEIDWSKAPADATHYRSADGVYARHWIKTGSDGRRMFMRLDDKVWWHDDHLPVDISMCVARPVPWGGEGLPPVGTVCEFTHSGVDGEWIPVFVVGLHKGHMYGHTENYRWRDRQGCCHVQLIGDDLEGVKFRPIKTPEQIAAEEREHAVRNACTDIARTLDPFKDYIPSANAAIAVVRAMIDAGYRKQEAK